MSVRRGRALGGSGVQVYTCSPCAQGACMFFRARATCAIDGIPARVFFSMFREGEGEERRGGREREERGKREGREREEGVVG